MFNQSPTVRRSQIVQSKKPTNAKRITRNKRVSTKESRVRKEAVKVTQEERIPSYQYQEMRRKSMELETMKQRHQHLIERLSRVKSLVNSKTVNQESDVADKEKALDLQEMLEPDIIVKKEAVEVEPKALPNEEPLTVIEETMETNTPDKFQRLKSKLQDTLRKRAKLNSKLEEMMQKKFTNDSKEMVEQRMKARLEREATVREVQRRLDEKKEAEKEKELCLKEKNLRQILETLKSEVKNASESLSPQEGSAKKKSRREMRKHLQDRVEPKPELAMSLESRTENIREMEEEIAALQKKMEDIRSGAEHQSECIKIEENDPQEICSVAEEKSLNLVEDEAYKSEEEVSIEKMENEKTLKMVNDEDRKKLEVEPLLDTEVNLNDSSLNEETELDEYVCADEIKSNHPSMEFGNSHPDIHAGSPGNAGWQTRGML